MKIWMTQILWRKIGARICDADYPGAEWSADSGEKGGPSMTFFFFPEVYRIGGSWAWEAE